jgi:hypothetical protein
MTDPQPPSDTPTHRADAADPDDGTDNPLESPERTAPPAGEPPPESPDHWASELFDD